MRAESSVIKIVNKISEFLLISKMKKKNVNIIYKEQSQGKIQEKKIILVGVFERQKVTSSFFF
jgi:hypothetical protein